MDIMNKFVDAKLKGSDEYRQGHVISVDPLKIRGRTGTEYECEGNVVIVTCPLYIGKECPKA